MRRTPPSTISVPYGDTTHRIMSPSSFNTANHYDNQCTSLFGDPVPPPVDICFEDLDKDLYGTLRGRSNSLQSNSIVDDFPKANSFTTLTSRGSALASNRRRPSSQLSRQESDDQAPGRLFSESPERGMSRSPTVDSRFSMDNIRYIPEHTISSRPELVISPPSQDYDPADLWNSNLSGRSRRRSSELSDDIRGNLETIRSQPEIDNFPKRIFSKEPMRFRRQESNESFSSGEWFKPSNDYQEWSKIPRLRPSSKNVMSINQESGSHHGSPLASLIQGSNASTSSDEKVSPDMVKIANSRDDAPLLIISRDIDGPSIIEDSPPKELPPPEAATISKELPLPIVTNAVTTGSNFRANPPRPQKKHSFTIIAERSPQSSRPTSPSPGNSGRVSPFLGYGFREPARPSSRRKSLTSSKITLPNIVDPNNNLNTSDESVRPLVQFNMSSLSGPVAHNQTTAKSILQPKPKPPARTKKKQHSTQSAKPKELPKVHSFESLPKIVSTSAPKLPPRRLNKTSLELSSAKKVGLLLPNQNPTSQQRGLLRVYSAESSRSSNREKDESLSQSARLRRRSSLSPIGKEARRGSNSSERRSSSLTMPRSSIASDRRSSNLSTVTTSDFSFRRSSISPPRNITDPSMLNVRSVKSSPRSPRRVAKPTSLSPIIGTPNKDTQLSTDEQPPSGSNSRRSSHSKIPLVEGSKTPSRSNSRVASRSNSRAPSALNSRATSPSKDLLPVSRPNSRVTSRPTSRSSSRADSRVPSRIPSRSNSRASDHDRFDPTAKKAASLSPAKSRNASPSWKKSRSESPRKSPNRSTNPRKSPSPPRMRSTSRTERRSSIASRSPLHAKSLSPMRNEKPLAQIPKVASKKEPTASAKKTTSNLKKPEASVKRSSSVGRPSKTAKGKEMETKKEPATNTLKSGVKAASSLRNVSTVKRETSNLRRETSNVKKAPSNTKPELSKAKPAKKEPTPLKRETSNVQRTGARTVKRETSNVKRTTSIPKREGPGIKRETSNLKREPSNAKRDPSKIKRESSTVRKDPAKLKREPSNLKKEPSNLKKEPSNLKREPSNLKREPSNLKREPSNLKREGSRMSLKKTTSSSKIEAIAKMALPKNRSDSNLSKKLVKSNSFRNEKASAAATAEESDASTVPADCLKDDEAGDEHKTDKLIPLTKANVISMTTAAITAQPVQITTSITNQMPLTKSSSSNQLLGGSDSTGTKDMKDMDPVSILEKSQKTLENVQKTVADATEEIQKTINENLTDLKTMESDYGRSSDDSTAPFDKSDSLTTILENPAARIPTTDTDAKAASAADAAGESKSPAPPGQPIEANVSVLTTKKSSENLLHPNTNHNNNNTNNSSTSSMVNGAHDNTEDMAERVSERAISVLPEVECESANLQSYDVHSGDDGEKSSRSNNNNDEVHVTGTNMEPDSTVKGHADGAGAKSEAGAKMEGNEHKGDDSQEYLDDAKPKGCCSRFCSKLCMPCRRCQCCSCCRRKKPGSAKSDERIIVEEVNEKRGCWGRMCSCCRKKKKTTSMESRMQPRHMEPIQEERGSDNSMPAKKQNKCCLCLGKVFCCRKTNKVETMDEDGEEVRRCCFCIPCGRKKKPANAWQDRRESIISDPPPQPGCCSRLCSKIFCCCRKQKPVSESRRTSMNSKKQSIAPTIPLEDSRPKLHNDLVEFNSKMKGAIPVMPLWLAWFCMICNCIIPGFGTILSGFFCICVGIPRFSQYDSAKARIGSLIINCIVGVAQAFCVLFCFVGWGWSIWWGAIMLKTARKLKKIRRVEELEMQEEQRQQAAEKARIERDVEAQKKEDKK